MAQTIDDKVFAFDDAMVRVVMVRGEPWFVASDVGRALELQNVRASIADFDDDEKGVNTIYTLGGEQTVAILSEPGLYRLIVLSRAPRAKQFQRWIYHDVLPQIRKTGRYEAEPSPAHPETSPMDAPLLHRLQLVRECRSIHGREVAKVMWRKLGLPAVPPPPRTGVDEARECLRHILDAASPEGRTLRELIALALDDSETERLCLLACGVRVYAESETFAIASHHPFLRDILKGTAWSGPGGHVRVLRRLSSATPVGPTRMGPLQVRATAFHADMLDEFVS